MLHPRRKLPCSTLLRRMQSMRCHILIAIDIRARPFAWWVILLRTTLLDWLLQPGRWLLILP